MATRTNAKKMLIDALNQDFLAEGFADFLEIGLPEFDNAEMDVNAAIIWEGKLSRHLCTIFTLFEGLFPLEIPLRMGQRNATQQGMLLAALQATRTVGAYYNTDLAAAADTLKETIEGVTPVNGQVVVDAGLWENIYYQAGELLQALGADQHVVDVGQDIIQAAQVMSDTILNNFIDAVTVTESVLTNVKSLARWVAAHLGAE
jgi:hypothetical protein